MKLRRSMPRLLVLPALALSSMVAFAGARTAAPVSIDTVNRFATGDVGFVRNTPDDVQRIACSYISGTTPMGVCLAATKEGVFVQCQTTDAALMDVITSLNEDSYLVFAWATNNVCTFIHIENTSASDPKR